MVYKYNDVIAFIKSNGCISVKEFSIKGFDLFRNKKSKVEYYIKKEDEIDIITYYGILHGLKIIPPVENVSGYMKYISFREGLHKFSVK